MADGILAKLIILPFDQSDNVQVGPPVGPPFIAQFNPESFSVSTEFNLGPEKPADGDVGAEAKFESIKPRTFSFEFLLDGTGADGTVTDVTAQLLLFKVTTGFNGAIHRPRFLVIQWGVFIASCALEKYTVNYKLFRPDGTPLRATLSASFREHHPKGLSELLKNLASPDITHAHEVVAGESLPLVCFRTYDDSAYYMQVAKANGLDNVRRLTTGRTLYLPPVQ